MGSGSSRNDGGIRGVMNEKRYEDSMKSVCICVVAMILLIVIIGFTSCNNKQKEGIIVQKEFVPQHNRTVLIPIYSGKVTRVFPSSRFVPDKYILHLFDTVSKTKCKVSVEKEIYDQIELNEYYKKKYE